MARITNGGFRPKVGSTIQTSRGPRIVQPPSKMTEEYINKVDSCRHLLPEPGPQVVGELVVEIRRLHAQLNEIHVSQAWLDHLVESAAARLGMGLWESIVAEAHDSFVEKR